MSSKISHLIVLNLWFVVISIYCESFCENPTLDSAMTFEDKTYLFRDKYFWIFAPNSEPIFMNKINDTFIAGVLGSTLQSIDAIFWTDIEGDEKLVYAFDKNKYYFLVIGFSNGQREIVSIHSSHQKYIPDNLKYYGGTLSDWFPNPIDTALVIPNSEGVLQLLLFHGSFARHLKLAELGKAWTKGQEIDIPFEGSLKEVTKIDAIFGVHSDDKTVIVISGEKYCEFNKYDIDFSKTNDKILDISCEWKESTELFNCGKETTTSTSTSGNTSHTYQTTQSSDIIVDLTTDSETTETQNNVGINSIVILIIIVVFLLFLFIGFVVILLALYLNRNPDKNKYSSSGPAFGIGISVTNRSQSLDSPSMASVVTIDSITGQPLSPTSP